MLETGAVTPSVGYSFDAYGAYVVRPSVRSNRENVGVRRGGVGAAAARRCATQADDD